MTLSEIHARHALVTARYVPKPVTLREPMPVSPSQMKQVEEVRQ